MSSPSFSEPNIVSKNKSNSSSNKIMEGNVQQTEADIYQTAVEMPKPAEQSVMQKKIVPDGRWTGSLVFAVLAIVIGSSFQFGYHIGCMNMPGGLIKGLFAKEAVFHRLEDRVKNFTLSSPYLQKDNLNFDLLTELKIVDREDPDYKEIAAAVGAKIGLLVSIFAIGGMIGGVSVGFVADKLGRKMALLCNNGLVFLAAGLMTSAKHLDNYPNDSYISVAYSLLFFGRFVIGLNSGLNSGMAPMYLMEISPANLRGTIGSFAQLFITIGILFSQFIGMPFVLGNFLWPFIFAFAVVPAIIQIPALFFCPESPKYNLLIRKQRDQAESDLRELRGGDDVEAELDQLLEDDAVAQAQVKVSMISMFGPKLRWPLMLAMFMMISQQLSGINAAMFYSDKIFGDAGLLGLWKKGATLAMGLINVIMTVVSVYLVDSPMFGRRTLHIIGMIGMAFSSTAIAGTMLLAKSHKEYTFISYLSILFVLLFVISFATGPGSIPWFYVNEIFPSNARSNASSYAVLTNWFFTFLVGILWPIVSDAIGEYSFFIFTVFLIAFIVFAWIFLPETKNKTLDEIQREMGISDVAGDEEGGEEE